MSTIKDLKFDSKNANKHTQKGMRLLDKSISKLGLGRSILIDKDNNIIAGNGVVETAGQLGLEKVKIIETDGSEIIAVKRKDISIDSKKGRELAIADNQTAKVGIDFDLDVINDLSIDLDIDLSSEWEIPQVGDINEMDVWNETNMPEFAPGDKEIKAIFIFKDEKHREEWFIENNFESTHKRSGTWTVRL